ncbi:MAG: hypothetical protein E7022_10295 [Desulfovibrio desulfuricans]|nr:hypothetical protein [Desulfovibrio desulfuricans]
MIFDFFKSKKNDKTPHLITGSEFGTAVEHMLQDASKFITLVSPYIKFNARVFDILQQKREEHVVITIIYRDDFEQSSVAEFLYKRSNLHAKCYITENSFLIGSMNLYDYSQTNNDEFGILIYKNDFPIVYEHCYKEVERLARNYTNNKNKLRNKSLISSHNITDKLFCECREKKTDNLVVNCKYSYLEIKEALNFTGDIKGGINQIGQNKILLIMRSNSKYENKQIGNVIYFVGQNTGSIEQKIIYGNKVLYDAYENPEAKIYLFRDNIFYGEVYVCERPYVENGKLIYPLKLSDKHDAQKSIDENVNNISEFSTC